MTVLNTEAGVDVAENTAGKLDVLEQLTKPEIQEALTVLIDQLPKLAEMTTKLTAAYDFVQTAMNDEVLMNDVTNGIAEVVKPLQAKAKSIAAAAIEAKDRAEVNTGTIGIFGLMNMLKDPQVQYALRFMQAFLEVTAEQKK